MKIGDKVYFGRTHGEKTLGEIIKINRVNVRVRQLESRGTMRMSPIGTVWTVPMHLCSPAQGPESKRPDKTIMQEIQNTYGALSPENLSWDGERAPAQVRAAYALLNRKLKDLFLELGREVSEGEAYALPSSLF